MTRVDTLLGKPRALQIVKLKTDNNLSTCLLPPMPVYLPFVNLGCWLFVLSIKVQSADQIRSNEALEYCKIIAAT
jgi:hypothetical protein